MRLAAVEQRGEQAPEMRVDLPVGVQQPDPAFAIEVADRPAQPVDCLGQLFRFLGALDACFVELGQLLLGDEIDRADALALGRQPLQQCRLRFRIDALAFVEAELFGQPLRQALEPFEADPSIFGAAGFLTFGPGRSCARRSRAAERIRSPRRMRMRPRRPRLRRRRSASAAADVSRSHLAARPSSSRIAASSRWGSG